MSSRLVRLFFGAFFLACFGMISVLLIADVIGIDLRLMWLNAKGGCYPWSPAVVEYRDGMTLCPGQTVRLRLLIKNHPTLGKDI